MCTLHDFLCSKIKFMHTNTVTESHSCSVKTTHTPRVHLIYSASLKGERKSWVMTNYSTNTRPDRYIIHTLYTYIYVIKFRLSCIIVGAVSSGPSTSRPLPKYAYRHRCEICHKMLILGRPAVLNIHLGKHRDPRVWKCRICGRGYLQARELTKHQRRTHNMIACDPCGNVCNNPWEVNVHRLHHQTMRKFGCSFCGKTFSIKHNLKSHYTIHTSKLIKQVLADAGGYQEVRQQLVQQGEATGNGDDGREDGQRQSTPTQSGAKRYICRECGKTLCGINALALHLVMHRVSNRI